MKPTNRPSWLNGQLRGRTILLVQPADLPLVEDCISEAAAAIVLIPDAQRLDEMKARAESFGIHPSTTWVEGTLESLNGDAGPWDAIVLDRRIDAPVPLNDSALATLRRLTHDGGQLYLVHRSSPTASGADSSDLAASLQAVVSQFEPRQLLALEDRLLISLDVRLAPSVPSASADWLAQLGKGLRAAVASQPIALRESDDAESTTVDALQAKVAQLESELDAVRSTLHRRTIELLEASELSGGSEMSREELELKARHATAQLEHLKGMLSHRLGVALVQNGTSVRGLLSLPKTLWGLAEEARRRRGGAPLPIAMIGWLNRIRNPLKRLLGTGARPPAVQRYALHEGRPAREFEAPPEIEQGQALSRLRVACIMDDFSARSFEHECELIELRPDSWRKQMEECRPHLLLVESAWRGVDQQWHNLVNRNPPVLRDILRYCQEEATIPTAFWNKEDPVHFSTFLNTAALFDFVFTTDFDCIHRYKDLLGHDRVYLLPFACQPALQNPIETFERKAAASFAGAYYLRYPERQRDFLRIMMTLLERMPVEIYDRNLGQSDVRYQFPEHYRSFVVGSLPFSKIDLAYKGYEYGINVNSIKYSQSMFARRVYELLASNTITVSNYSRGVRLLFGELVLATDDGHTLWTWLERLQTTDGSWRKHRLAGLRKVMGAHTYQDRLAHIAAKAFKLDRPRLLPRVLVVAQPKTKTQLDSIMRAFSQQTYEHAELDLFLPDNLCLLAHERRPFVHVRAAKDAMSLAVEALRARADYVAVFDARDFYGPSYLLDLALATRYFGGSVIGKGTYHAWTEENEVALRSDTPPYQHAEALAPSRSILHVSSAGSLSVRDLLDEKTLCPETLGNTGASLLSVDEQSYCAGGAPHAEDPRLLAAVGDLRGVDLGLTIEEVLEQATAIDTPDRSKIPGVPTLSPTQLSELFPAGVRDGVAISYDARGMKVEASQDENTVSYIYENSTHTPSEWGFAGSTRFQLEAGPGLKLEAVVLFLNAAGKKINSTIQPISTNVEVPIPAGTASLRLGLRVAGHGSTYVSRWLMGHGATQAPTRILPRSETLVLTNQYPSKEELYRNAFVHRRVLEYRRGGLHVDVFRFRPASCYDVREFGGVDVITGTRTDLHALLGTGRIRRVLVHFLDADMMSVLEPFLDDLQVVVWLHGADIQPWHRRAFNYTDAAAQANAQALSVHREAFWSGVLRSSHPNLHFVFVSRHFAEEVMEDYGLRLPTDRFDIIPNLIDTELFQYVPKPAQQRLKILTIRPFATRTYANDLAVAAIVELSRRPCFAELNFHIIGDGELFEATVAPLRTLSNVRLEKRFLTQTSIAELHRDYGIFLCPTRSDTQGVSRGEAMASGLVPITTDVAAVPEFVDEHCAFLAPPEDALALANAIDALYRDPDRFLRMSEAAAKRVRSQCGPRETTAREIALISTNDRSTSESPFM